MSFGGNAPHSASIVQGDAAADAFDNFAVTLQGGSMTQTSVTDQQGSLHKAWVSQNSDVVNYSSTVNQSGTGNTALVLQGNPDSPAGFSATAPVMARTNFAGPGLPSLPVFSGFNP